MTDMTCPVTLAIAAMNGEPITKPTRFKRQQELEQQLVDFRPDNIEAEELLDAILTGLERRYPTSDDVRYYAEKLKAAVDQLREPV